jgi:predicted DNA-binding ribbon-helix-helix protein
MPRPIKRSVTIAGHSTSVSLEPEFWDALKDIATRRHMSMAALLEEIDAARRAMGLSTAARLYALDHYRSESRGSVEKSPP